LSVDSLVLPSGAVRAVVSDVARFGREGVETGGFFLAATGSERVHGVAYAGTRGIVRRRDLLRVSDLALDSLFAHTEANDLWIPAQYHSHRFQAFMSKCDLEHGLSVEGFVTTIVPFFADPPANASAWGWWRFDEWWLPLPPPPIVRGDVVSVSFDEEGVRVR
jgi:hypothetical protein